MKRFNWFFIYALLNLSVSAKQMLSFEISQVLSLSPQTQISLLTCSPSNDAVFTLYGHTALRVYDPESKIDMVYNYGSFDDSKPNFFYHFAKGEMDYMLDAKPFNIFLLEYLSRGSEVIEQVLNLLTEEKEALWQALEWNRKSENKVYRYNYFFDNCATRPVFMIENNIQGYIKYVPTFEKKTFRELINNCTRNNPWITFGCDLALGMPADRIMTQRETFFIPDYLKNAFDKAEIIREGKAESLVMQTIILAEKNQIPVTKSFITSPIAIFTLLFIVIMMLTYNEWQKKRYYRLIDIILFFCTGIAGCILFFLNFMSVHPCTFPNISLLWLHPIHLTGIILFSVKKFKTMAYWYHLINFSVILIMFVGWFFITQHCNIAFIPLIASLLLRSGWALLRKINE